MSQDSGLHRSKSGFIDKTNSNNVSKEKLMLKDDGDVQSISFSPKHRVDLKFLKDSPMNSKPDVLIDDKDVLRINTV